jgi:hypothetical protein
MIPLKMGAAIAAETSQKKGVMRFSGVRLAMPARCSAAGGKFEDDPADFQRPERAGSGDGEKSRKTS